MDKLKDRRTFRAPEKYARYWHAKLNFIKKETPYTTDFLCSQPKKHDYRSIFAADRDRIMYTTSFLRLSAKTQIFTVGSNDNVRTRLTHTLEVSQIARTIASELGLDVELTEAMALGHDVGHTPYGHIGERTLNKISHEERASTKVEDFTVNETSLKNYKGFKHNQQSVRVLVDFSKDISVSNYCLYGIRNHSDLYYDNDISSASFYSWYDPFCSFEHQGSRIPSWSFESFVVYWADEIAQRHHDIEDAYRCKLIDKSGIINLLSLLLKYFDSKANRFSKKLDDLQKGKDDDFERKLSSFVVDFYVSAIISEMSLAITLVASKYTIKNRNDFVGLYPDMKEIDVRTIMYLVNSGSFTGTDKLFSRELKDIIIPSYMVQRQDGKGGFTVRKLVNAYITNPQQLPDKYISDIFRRELPRAFSVDDHNQIRAVLSSASLPQDYLEWNPVHSRKALRKICESPEGYRRVYPLIFRTIFDYISGMTDSFAHEEYIRLY